MQVGITSVDLSIALCRVGDDWQLLQEVSQLFLDSLPEMLETIRRAIDDRSGPRLEMSAHSLKGSVSNFGAEAATAASYELELRGRQMNWDDVEAAYRELVNQMENLRPELEDVIRRPAP